MEEKLIFKIAKAFKGQVVFYNRDSNTTAISKMIHFKGSPKKVNSVIYFEIIDEKVFPIPALSFVEDGYGERKHVLAKELIQEWIKDYEKDIEEDKFIIVKMSELVSKETHGNGYL